MGFQRPSDFGVHSQHWRLAHKAELVECGIPHEVADSDRRWNYVLLHSEDHLRTGWLPSWITPPQAARLLTLIEGEIGDSIGYDIVRVLRGRRDGKGDAP